MSRAELARRIERRLVAGTVLANTAGALVVYLYLSVVFPRPERAGTLGATEVTGLVLVAFLVAATAVGIAVGLRRSRHVRAWARGDAPATAVERSEVLRLPGRLVVLTAQQWGASVVVFTALNLDTSVEVALEAAVTIVFGGLVTCAAAWLITERELRPALALVLAGAPPAEAGSLGIGSRILLTWALCSGIPLIGIALVPIGEDGPASSLVAPIVFLAAVALVAGLVLMKLAMRGVADPVREVQGAMEAVAEGRTDIRVDVDDASEVGRLQAGFNAMVEGLAERERLRDLFGRQVGLDVARGALERGATLGGESREVGALFVDVIGSTALAHREAPEEVVARLNAFFSIVVDAVECHGGFVNKFEGDAALCVFGAPVECGDVAARALATARDLAARLAAADGLEAAIGVAFGTAVAGHVGAESRYEYTVIGDPINEAARLCELAKGHPGRVLATGAAVHAAGDEEAASWRLGGEATLRGRPEPTRLAVPVAGAPLTLDSTVGGPE